MVWKVFQDGVDRLSAAVLNFYFMRQSVMVFADATARDAALAGIVTNGMVVYLTSTERLAVRRAGAWVEFDNPDDKQTVRSTSLSLTTSYQDVFSVSVISGRTYQIDATCHVTGMTAGNRSTYGVSIMASYSSAPSNCFHMFQSSFGIGGSSPAMQGSGFGTSAADEYTAASSPGSANPAIVSDESYLMLGIFTATSTGTVKIRMKKLTGSGTGAVQPGSALILRDVT